MGDRVYKAEPHEKYLNQVNLFRKCPKRGTNCSPGVTGAVQRECVKLKERGLEIAP